MRYIILLAFLLVSALAVAQPNFEKYYNAEVASVYDGDTVRMNIELGLGLWLKNESVRLYGINTPEIRGVERPQGIVSRDALINMLDGRRVALQTYDDKRGKYGRLLGTLWVLGKGEWCPEYTWCNVNEQLVKEGLATAEKY